MVGKCAKPKKTILYVLKLIYPVCGDSMRCSNKFTTNVSGHQEIVTYNGSRQDGNSSNFPIALRHQYCLLGCHYHMKQCPVWFRHFTDLINMSVKYLLASILCNNVTLLWCCFLFNLFCQSLWSQSHPICSKLYCYQ